MIQPPAVGRGVLHIAAVCLLPSTGGHQAWFLYGREAQLEVLRRERNARTARIVVALRDYDAPSPSASRTSSTDPSRAVQPRSARRSRRARSSRCIPPEERIITIEAAPQLRPEQPNAVTADSGSRHRGPQRPMCFWPPPCGCGPEPDRAGRGARPRSHDLSRGDQHPGMAARSPHCMQRPRSCRPPSRHCRRSRPTCQ